MAKRTVQMIRSGRNHGVPSAEPARGIPLPGNPVRMRNLYGKGRIIPGTGAKNANRVARNFGYQNHKQMMRFWAALDPRNYGGL